MVTEGKYVCVCSVKILLRQLTTCKLICKMLTMCGAETTKLFCYSSATISLPFSYSYTVSNLSRRRRGGYASVIVLSALLVQLQPE